MHGVEGSEAVYGVSIRDVLRSVEAAEASTAKTATDVVLTLMVAGLIKDAALVEAEMAVAEMEHEVAIARVYLA